MLHPDDGSVESWSAEGSAEKMRHDFADFEPRWEGNIHSWYQLLSSPEQCAQITRVGPVDIEMALDGQKAAEEMDS